MQSLISYMARLFKAAPWFFCALLFAAAGFLLYADVITNGVFLFDDFEYIVGNKNIQDFSLSSLFSDPRYIGYASFALNYVLDGENPYGYHLLNVIIHIANAFQVFLLVGLILRILHFEDEQPFLKQAASVFAGMLFLVHPIETQAVSYVTQRFTSLSAFFYLGSILAYLASRVRFEMGMQTVREYGIYALGMMSCILAMKTKEIAFTIPFMIAILEYLLFIRSGLSFRRIIYLTPFFATLIIIPISLLGPEWGLLSSSTGIAEVTRTEKLFDLYERSTFDYLINQFRVIVIYLRLLFLPINQLVVYDLQTVHSVFEVVVIAPFLFLFSIAGAGVLCWRRARTAVPADAPVYYIASIGIAWFFVTVSIESSVIPIKDIIFEHRAYLPSVGFFTLFAVLFVRSIKRFFREKYRVLGMVASMLALLLLLSSLTYTRNFIWVDEVALWDDVVKKTGKAIGYNNRGNAYMNKGQLELALRDLDKTITFFPNASDRMAWENSDFTPSNMSKTYLTRGNIFVMLGDPIRAQAEFEMARRVMFSQ